MDTAFQNYHQRATLVCRRIVYKHSLLSEEEPSCSTAPDTMPGFQGHPSAQAMKEKANAGMDLNIGLQGGVHGRSNERRFITL